MADDPPSPRSRESSSSSRTGRQHPLAVSTSPARPTIGKRSSSGSIGSSSSSPSRTSPTSSPRQSPLSRSVSGYLPPVPSASLAMPIQTAPSSPPRRSMGLSTSSLSVSPSSHSQDERSSFSSAVSVAGTELTSADEGYSGSESGRKYSSDSSVGGMMMPTGGAGSSHAISIPPSASGMMSGAGGISITTSSLPASSVRLSTTPLYPSPLAQASGPDEYADQARDDGDNESEVDWENGRGFEKDESPLRRETVFGDIDLSPSTSTVGLPGENALGLEGHSPGLTPRAPRRVSSLDTESTPEAGPSTSTFRRASGRGRRSLAVADERLSANPRSSRRRDSASSLGYDSFKSKSGSISGSSPLSTHTPRGLPSLSTSLGPSTSSPTSSIASGSTMSPPSAASSPSSGSSRSLGRRSSISVTSPPSRVFAPASPGAARAPRSSLSAAIAGAGGMPGPYPTPPPPSESIKLQKVPDFVRSAVEVRQQLGVSPTSSMLFGGQDLQSMDAVTSSAASGLTAPMLQPNFFKELTPPVPKTPAATRVPSPATSQSGSGASDTIKSEPASGSSSRVQSRAPSRRASADKGQPITQSALPAPPPLASPLFLPGHGHSASSASSSSTGAGTGSAFSPLFSLPASPGGTRTRSRSVLQGAGHYRTTSASMSSTSSAVPVADSFAGRGSIGSDTHFGSVPTGTTGGSAPTWRAHDLGVSPVPLGILSPPGLSPGPGQQRIVSEGAAASFLATEPTRHARQKSASALKAHRTSMAMTRGIAGLVGIESPATPGPSSPEGTDEYAQIILASRNAKMRKWKTSTTSVSSLLNDRPTSADAGELSPPPLDEADITDSESGRFGLHAPGASYGSKEIEWVDWLDEYRKMKEAKLKAEKAERGDFGELEVSSQPPSTSYLTTAGFQSSLSPFSGASEFNPFESTTAAMNLDQHQHLHSRENSGLSTSGVEPHPPTAFAISPRSNVFPIRNPGPGAPPLRSRQSTDSFNAPSMMSTASPNTRRRRKTQIGAKIDAWWTAVRASFTTEGKTPGTVFEEERGAKARRGRPLGPTSSAASAADSSYNAGRTSSQFTRPGDEVQHASLRHAASAQDLKSPTEPSVPSGALAPRPSLAPPSAGVRGHSPSSGESEGAVAAKTDFRRRNPQLSLNLGPSFNTLMTSQGQEQPGASALVSSSDSSAASQLEQPVNFSDKKRGPVPHTERGRSGSALQGLPGLTPGHAPMWDRTPHLVPQAPPGEAAAVPLKGVKASDSTSNSPLFSMNTVKQQVKMRLSTAKENCDKELKKIVREITDYVDADMEKRRMEYGTPLLSPKGGDFGELINTADMSFSQFPPLDANSDSEAMADVDGPDDGGNSDAGGSRRSSTRERDVAGASSPSSANLSRRGSFNSRRLSSVATRKRQTTAQVRQGELAVRVGRAFAGGRSSPGSSRSTSRSRSPLPPHPAVSSSPSHLNVSNSALGEGAQHAAFIATLQDISTVATEIMDTSVATLTAKPGSLAEYIIRVQQIGRAWDDSPELPCRGYYVQLLLTVAGLNKVVEWWEAEKGFWSFAGTEETDAEPIVFVSRGVEEESRSPGQIFTARAGDNSDVPVSTLPAAKYSPLGIDLGELKSPAPSSFRDATDLREAVEQTRKQTLLVELTLDGQLMQYASSAWRDLTGLDLSDCIGAHMADFLFEDDAAVFAEATRQLEADDSHTVEVRFRLRVAASSVSSEQDDYEEFYEIMEGKGMLMLDGLDGSPSHTMWVIRPAPLSPVLASPDQPQKDRSAALRAIQSKGAFSDPLAPFALGKNFATEPLLCRICERMVPAWFFEKHNETCHETHRLESDISECNDHLRELIRAVEEMADALDHTDNSEEGIEYRGIHFELSGYEERSSMIDSLHDLFDRVIDILRTALTISTPAVPEEPAEVPIEQQRLLSPHSESSLAIVMRWQRPVSQEPAMVRLVADTEEQIRFKLNSVNRLRNTLLYAEKVREEWETRATDALNQWEQEKQPSPYASPQLHPVPSTGSPTSVEGTDSARHGPGALRRKSSHLFSSSGQSSPQTTPDDAAFGNRLLNVGSPATGSPASAPNMLLSPRIPASVPSSRAKPSSIKDFKVIKPISKGAFGSVYLARKITTGDYYAIKVLKKADMIAKNQVTNVKAERMILMTQTLSDFVVRLYYTFQSKDYLYLVMEYLNGGDCAALIKNMGELPEDWAKIYLAEVVVGLERLHSAGVIHRDIKPDNLLIDARGHLKVTDFGLSRIGLLGRQTRMPFSVRDVERRRFDHNPARSTSRDPGIPSRGSSPASTPLQTGGTTQTGYFGSLTVPESGATDTPTSESSGSGHAANLQKSILSRTSSPGSHAPAMSISGAQQTFVGTPDYLAPESILGLGMDVGVDWWALGVVCYEFIYGIPPFNDSSPEKVFDNILSRRIDWHEAEVEVSPEARDLMERLMCSDASRRLGVNGAAEIKNHPFFEGVDWDHLFEAEGPFIPQVKDPESTDYFDLRGATTMHHFGDDEALDGPASEPILPQPAPKQSLGATLSLPEPRRAARERSETEPSPHEDWGTFNFRNLPVLKQANDDVVRKIRDEQLISPLVTTPDSVLNRSTKARNLLDLRASGDLPSPATSSSSGSGVGATSRHSRMPSEAPSGPQPRQASVDFALNENRRNSLPTRLRSASVSGISPERPRIPSVWKPGTTEPAAGFSPMAMCATLPPAEPSAVLQPAFPGLLPVPPPISRKHIDCLIAMSNPITSKVLETLLTKLGCRCVVVPDGSEAILATSDVEFDVIFIDLNMPGVSGEQAARMILSTNNPSKGSKIIALCSPGGGFEGVGTLFSGVLYKPVRKNDVLDTLIQLGYVAKAKPESRRGSVDSRRGSAASIDVGGAAMQEGRRGSDELEAVAEVAGELGSPTPA